jgi:hypothetical protein
MKSLNSPARKDIIKFPTVKFALSRFCLSPRSLSLFSGSRDTRRPVLRAAVNPRPADYKTR